MLQKLAVAPCAWGVWYSTHKLQPSAYQYIKEIRSLGFKWTELGPPSYLAKNKTDLKNVLVKNNLSISGACLAYPFLSIQEKKQELIKQIKKLLDLMVFNQVPYLIIMDDSGAYTKEELSLHKNTHWKHSLAHLQEVHKLCEAKNLKLLYHPHAGTCIETESEILQFFELTKNKIPLCFDIGHHAYSGGDIYSFYKKHHELIEYIHIKNINFNLKGNLEKKGLGVEEIFLKGVMCQLEEGDLDIKKFKSILNQHNYLGFLVFEQDRFGMDTTTMLDSAKNNLDYWMAI